MKQIADVSIIVANYNNGKYLVEFMESVNNSTMLPKELIIVDDGSEDDSKMILLNYNNPGYLKLIFFEENKGFTTALNKGIEMAAAKYIMRADPDDVFLYDRIEKQFRFMEENPDVDICGANVLYFKSPDHTIINKSNFPLTLRN